MTSFADIIDNLPAAQLFWSDLVPSKNRQAYNQMLVKMFDLFLLPHVCDWNSQMQCSFFQKYIKIQETNELFDLLTYMLQLQNTNVSLCLKQVVLNAITLNDVEAQATMSLVDAVTSWFESAATESVFILPLTLQHQQQQQKAYLALKKSDESLIDESLIDESLIKYIVFDPHSVVESPGRFAQLLQSELQKMYLTVTVQHVNPLLPNSSNTPQFKTMLFSFFVRNPAWFDNPLGLLQMLIPQEPLNSTLFALHMFLTTMRYIKLEKYNNEVLYNFSDTKTNITSQDVAGALFFKYLELQTLATGLDPDRRASVILEMQEMLQR